MDPQKALTDRWKLVRYTDHDRLNQEAFAAIAQEMGGNG